MAIFNGLNKPRAIQLYLFCYNILSFVLWTGIMILLLGNMVIDPVWSSVTRAAKSPAGCGPCCLFDMHTWHAVFKALPKGFAVFGSLLGYVQALAVLEIFHAALGKWCVPRQARSSRTRNHAPLHRVVLARFGLARSLLMAG